MTRNKSKSTIKRQKPQSSQIIKQTQTQTQSFSGPIPAPDIMARYNEVIPNAAERILAMAENDAQHQRDIEMLALNSHAKERRRGQYFGVVVTGLAFITAGIALFLGHPTSAATIGGTTVVGLATAFVVGKKAK